VRRSWQPRMGSSERPQAAQPEGPGRARALVLDGSLSPRNGSPNADTSSSDGEVVGSGDARERILDAAEDLFAADGFDATPTSRIAHRAAVAKGLLFYYFPGKMDLLCTLFVERLPVHSSSSVAGIAVRGDVAGSLVRLADRIGLTSHHREVLSAILFREASTHPDVREHPGALHTSLMELTEEVLDAASPAKAGPRSTQSGRWHVRGRADARGQLPPFQRPGARSRPKC
jgi:AcrR family transcriptional regulator